MFLFKHIFTFLFLLKCLFTFLGKMEEYTLAKDIYGEGTPTQGICGEGSSLYAIKSSFLALCNDLGMGKGKQKVYIDEDILIVSSKRGRGHGSTRGRGCQIKKEFVLKDLKEKNGHDGGVEEKFEGRKNWVPTNVETLISIHGEIDEDFMKNVKKQSALKF